MNTDHELKRLWDIIDSLGVCMLITKGQNGLESRPMRGHTMRGQREIWFLTKDENPSAEAVTRSEHEVSLAYACPRSNTYVSLTGTATIARDEAMLNNLWTSDHEVWFDCSKTDPRIKTLCFHPEGADYWDGPSSEITIRWALTMAKLKRGKAHVGEHEHLDIA